AQGVAWDLTVGNPNTPVFTADDTARMASDPQVAGVMPVAAPEGRGSINGLEATVVGIDVSRGVASPVVDGRLPQERGEVALGRHTAAQLHAHVGDTVSIAFDGTPASVKVVGTALLNTGLSP